MLGFRWLEAGDCEPVVLIHGIPTSPELSRRVLPLVPGTRLLAWEMVGFGRSWRHGLGADISVRAQAGHVIPWLDEVGIEKAVLVPSNACWKSGAQDASRVRKVAHRRA